MATLQQLGTRVQTIQRRIHLITAVHRRLSSTDEHVDWSMDVSNIRDFSRLFYGSTGSGDLSSWTFQGICSLDQMFENSTGCFDVSSCLISEPMSFKRMLYNTTSVMLFPRFVTDSADLYWGALLDMYTATYEFDEVVEALLPAFAQRNPLPDQRILYHEAVMYYVSKVYMAPALDAWIRSRFSSEQQQSMDGAMVICNSVHNASTFIAANEPVGLVDVGQVLSA